MTLSVSSSTSCAKRHLIDSSVTKMYNFKGFPGISGTNTRGAANTYLIWSKACCCSFLQMNLILTFTFNNTENAYIFPTELAMN